jgi:hypothetical protein
MAGVLGNHRADHNHERNRSTRGLRRENGRGQDDQRGNQKPSHRCLILADG